MIENDNEILHWVISKRWDTRYENLSKYLLDPEFKEYEKIRREIVKKKLKKIIPNILPYLLLISIFILPFFSYIGFSQLIQFGSILILSFAFYFWNDRIHKNCWIALLIDQEPNFNVRLTKLSFKEKIFMDIFLDIGYFILKFNKDLVRRENDFFN